ncbi:flagellar biosynthesis anti-sigma factor FlgM [Cohnella caldifontis]|uniref:flagellar biosynthesis anti-sigma factor FlgM n=1 Tax=Cohnella caldifontis TaxID=3027471 RepID=UPI0023ECEC2D|nr:flagellar biosynthesis anti-sigma factor FlgM [Cohnella sp. YIM B05605]
MKINDTQRIGAYRTYTQSTEHRASGAESKRRKDEVAFSAEAMELLKAGKGDETDRSERIEQLKEQVSAGTYRVPDSLLAEKLLPFVR